MVTGMFYLGYVPSQFALHGDAAATVARVVQSGALFRLGIAAELVCNVLFLVSPLALYGLLGNTGRTAAVPMVAFAMASVPVACANLAHRFEVLSLLGDADYLQAFTTAQRHAKVKMQLDAYRHGLLVLAWAFNLFMSLVEVALQLAIVGYAWRWPRQVSN